MTQVHSSLRTLLMTNATKQRIINIVLAWKQLFPDEYQATVIHNKIRSSEQMTDWGEVHKGHSELGREVFRWPESLSVAFQSKLSPEEQEWLFGDNRSTVWMQKTFPEFVPSRKKG